MAFIGLDGTSEILLSAISATDTVLPISGAASVCVALGVNARFVPAKDAELFVSASGNVSRSRGAR